MAANGELPSATVSKAGSYSGYRFLLRVVLSASGARNLPLCSFCPHLSACGAASGFKGCRVFTPGRVPVLRRALVVEAESHRKHDRESGRISGPSPVLPGCRVLRLSLGSHPKG